MLQNPFFTIFGTEVKNSLNYWPIYLFFSSADMICEVKFDVPNEVCFQYVLLVNKMNK